MDEKCEKCPARDLCGGNVGELIEHIKLKHMDEIVRAGTSALMAEGAADLLDIILATFVMGYISRVSETVAEYESLPQVDVDLWGECFEE